MSTSEPGAPKLYTAHEAAAMLRVTIPALRRITHPRGPLQAVKIGRVVRYTARAVHDYQSRTAE
jgi:hypothetical protein